MSVAQLPVRARTAVGLAAAERATASLGGYPNVRNAARGGLTLGWRWVGGEPIPPRHLYDEVHRLLGLEKDLGDDQRAKQALFAVIDGLYYTTWQAQRATPGPTLPNDIAEIGEDDLTAALERTATLADDPAGERDQQSSLIQRLSELSLASPDSLGPPLNRTVVLPD
jgi:hypothetical protein